ncbi:hypothetical protein [Methanofollis aquaemaris]|uniref:hypothetical protein n=1 Tax=Methanofollis aquaemaris TaxID=126734 RepID=UPI00223F6737|nr:hypothetical protein [Methanofollis aquaemaris]
MHFKYERGLDTLSDEEILYLEYRDIHLPPDPFWWWHPSLILARRGPIDITLYVPGGVLWMQDARLRGVGGGGESRNLNFHLVLS